LSGATVAIQGFGKVGSYAAILFHEVGAKVIAVSDVHGGILNEAGLDVPDVLAHAQRTGKVMGFIGAKSITNSELLSLPCDILIPAAMENQIRADNANQVQAKLVSEGANGPTTPAADRLLFQRGIPVLPDILVNSGGVTVSYFEWVQNIENEQWSLEEVNSKLKAKMERATDAVLDKQVEINRSLATLEAARSAARAQGAAAEPPLEIADHRTAALVLAIERVATVAIERGIWP
jgi:glutamate dehydrogenase (NAD(P)+)